MMILMASARDSICQLASDSRLCFSCGTHQAKMTRKASMLFFTCVHAHKAKIIISIAISEFNIQIILWPQLSESILNQFFLVCFSIASIEQCFTYYPQQLMMLRGKRARKSNNKLYAKRLEHFQGKKRQKIFGTFGLLAFVIIHLDARRKWLIVWSVSRLLPLSHKCIYRPLNTVYYKIERSKRKNKFKGERKLLLYC